jgi:hypothetical protein
MKSGRLEFEPIVRIFTVILLIGLASALPAAKAEESKDAQALMEALGRSKHTLLDGVRQAAKGSAAPISAKFEMENGKLSLSVYTAEKGISVPAEENVLQELSGSPEQEKWAPEVEIFKDAPHIARSSEQLTLMALGEDFACRCDCPSAKNAAGNGLLGDSPDQEPQACR